MINTGNRKPYKVIHSIIKIQTVLDLFEKHIIPSITKSTYCHYTSHAVVNKGWNKSKIPNNNSPIYAMIKTTSSITPKDTFEHRIYSISTLPVLPLFVLLPNTPQLLRFHNMWHPHDVSKSLWLSFYIRIWMTFLALYLRLYLLITH